MKFLSIDSPLMQGLSKIADLLILNLLTLLCCLPIITVGPALTALNYMTLKMVRNEDTYIVKGFFKSFKENFIQSTLVWLLFLVMGLLLAGDYIILSGSETQYSGVMLVLIMVAAIFEICTFLYAFPVLAKFQNTIKRTLKNAFLISIMQFPKTIVMIIIYLIPLVIFFISFQLIPFVIFFGLSVPAWVSAKLYNKFFMKLEDQYWEANGGKPKDEDTDDERIFRDELDESLQDKTIQ